MAEKILFTAALGRVVPIDQALASGLGARQLLLRAGEELELDPTDGRVVRMVADGDIVAMKPPAEVAPPLPPAPPSPAASSPPDDTAKKAR